MVWTLAKEETEKLTLTLLGNSLVSTRIDPLKSVPSESDGLVFSYKIRTYLSEIPINIPSLGKRESLVAGFAGLNQSSPRWYLNHLAVFKSEEHFPLLSWNGFLGIAMFLKEIQGVKLPHLNYVQGTNSSSTRDNYTLYSITNSPEARIQIKSVLETLTKELGRNENNLLEIIRSALLNDNS